jgi:mannan polymerase II complex MNN10 subunit
MPSHLFFPAKKEVPPHVMVRRSQSQEGGTNRTDVNLLVTNDFSGLNNGIFILRINEWAISPFTAVLAFRHFEPHVELPFTEQSAMEHVIRTAQFKHQTQFFPQYWFNAYDNSRPEVFAQRDDETGLGPGDVRRGDYLVHFADMPEKDKAIEKYAGMLLTLLNIWENGTVQRGVSEDVAEFWADLRVWRIIGLRWKC